MLDQLFLYIFFGVTCGFAVGLTGVGGGSLMTPMLIFAGVPTATAIGTDLLYAAATKTSSLCLHAKQKTVRWPIVAALCAGSLPASIITAYCLAAFFPNTQSYEHILAKTLGVTLIGTAFFLMIKSKLSQKTGRSTSKSRRWVNRNQYWVTGCMGLILGVFVTLSSVGAGVIGTAVLLVLYTRLPSVFIVGTEIAHAVPLTLIAGMGHMMFLDTVNYQLLAALLTGSIPAVIIGTKVGKRLPDKWLHSFLITLLFLLGAKFLWV